MAKSPVQRVDERIQMMLRQIWTLVPGKITNVDTADMSCEVLIKVRSLAHEIPILVKVPIVYHKAGGATVIPPYTVDDIVMVGFSKYALLNLLQDDTVRFQQRQPEFAIEDAFILGGMILEQDKGGDNVLPTVNMMYYGRHDFGDGTLKITQGLAAARPASGQETGDLWYSTDTKDLFIWDGSEWQFLSGIPTRTVHVKTDNRGVSSGVGEYDVNVDIAASLIYARHGGTAASQSRITYYEIQLPKDAKSGKTISVKIKTRRDSTIETFTLTISKDGTADSTIDGVSINPSGLNAWEPQTKGSGDNYEPLSWILIEIRTTLDNMEDADFTEIEVVYFSEY